MEPDLTTLVGDRPVHVKGIEGLHVIDRCLLDGRGRLVGKVAVAAVATVAAAPARREYDERNDRARQLPDARHESSSLLVNGPSDHTGKAATADGGLGQASTSSRSVGRWEGASSDSRQPYRSHQRRSGPGAHQFHEPSSFMVAGTSSART